MGKGDNGGRKKKAVKETLKFISAGDSMRLMEADSNVALQIKLRPIKTEGGFIISDSDWEDIKKSNDKLKKVRNDFYTWAGVGFSTSVTLLGSMITIWFDKKEEIFGYTPFYVMVIMFLISLFVGIIFLFKGKGRSTTIEGAIDSLETVLGRIEKKTMGLKEPEYYGK